MHRHVSQLRFSWKDRKPNSRTPSRNPSRPLAQRGSRPPRYRASKMIKEKMTNVCGSTDPANLGVFSSFSSFPFLTFLLTSSLPTPPALSVWTWTNPSSACGHHLSRPFSSPFLGFGPKRFSSCILSIPLETGITILTSQHILTVTFEIPVSSSSVPTYRARLFYFILTF